MPFILRITEWKDVPVPVLVVKERHSANGTNTSSLIAPDAQGRSSQGSLVERVHLAGAAQRRGLPILHRLVGRVRDEYGISLDYSVISRARGWRCG